MTLRSKRVPQKVEALCASLFDAGLCLVQRELDPLHHTTRPIQRLFRTTAAENHEIIGVVHDSGSEHLTPTGDPPILQKTVHIQVCEQRTDHSALRCATSAVFATAHLSISVFIPLLRPNLQPHLYPTQHIS